MKRIFALIFLVCSFGSWSQSEVKIYEWEEIQGADGDTIYGVSFSKMKLDSVPESLSTYKHLRVLDLSKNKLKRIPTFLGELTELEVLDVSKNRLEVFPLPVCRMTNLKQLILNRNFFDYMPECIGYLENLEYIDLYDTPIHNLPEGLVKMKALKKIDLTGVRFAPSFQDKWNALLPNVEIIFDVPCQCME